jgi:hypothetical protein
MSDFDNADKVACKIHVANLAWSVEDPALKACFDSCGVVVAARVVRDDAGQSRGKFTPLLIS